MRNAFRNFSKQTTNLQAILNEFDPDELEDLEWNWEFWARDDQLAPDIAKTDWRNWVMIGGRGAGKTRAGAEWVRQLAIGEGQYVNPVTPIALVGETIHDVRSVMIEGPSGILACHREKDMPVWEPSLRKLTWANGTIARVFSADDPQSLRGPQFAAAWCDELCKWQAGRAAWDMLQFGMRLGERPQILVTTTPTPDKLLADILAQKCTVTSHASTFANAANLADGFMEQMQDLYGGTKLGRQELMGEILTIDSDALWSHDQLDSHRIKEPPEFARIIIGVDPAVTSGKNSDATGIIVSAIDDAGIGYVLHDGTQMRAKPLQWADKVVTLFHHYGADNIVCETNQGGELITTLLRQLDPAIPVKRVHSSTSKRMRAEPIAALYEQGRIRHVGSMPELEDEMCGFLPFEKSTKSPDRMDALVIGLTELMLKPKIKPAIRRI